MSSVSESSDVAVAEKIKIKEPSQYNIIVHNNHETSYQEVVYILSKAFEMTEVKAFDVAKMVDTTGKGVCGTYSKEVAETKLFLVDMIKNSLISMIPDRAIQIEILEFTMEIV